MKYFAKYLSISLLSCLVAVGFFGTDAHAKAIIRVNELECTITVTLHKEFFLHTSNWLDDQIKALEEAIRSRKEYLRLLIGPAKEMMQRQIEDLEDLLRDLEKARKDFKKKEAKARKDLSKKAAEWAKGIEDTWNDANYEYHCCKVRFAVKWKVRNEGAAPTQGYDQIAVSAVPGYRSNIDFGGNGFEGFDAEDFTNTPYDRDLRGEWGYDADGLTAAHEAGHEMGLNDQYQDERLRDGTLVSRPKYGREKDIMGRRGGKPVSKGKKFMPSGETVDIDIDNIGLILKKRYIQCPPECCKKPKTPALRTETDRDKGLVEDRTRDFEVWDQPIKEKIPEDKGGEKVQYKTIKKDKMDCDVGVLYRDMPDGGMEVEVSMLATGKGASTKFWEVDKVKMNIDGVKIKPAETENFYTDKTYTPSTNVAIATAVFAAIGSQYTRYADQAQSGGVCPVTGEKLPSTSRKVSPTTEAIDRAGMAAGLGLLASQAGAGSIKGTKATFKLDKDAAEKIRNGEAKFEIEANNTHKPQSEKIEIPIGK